MLPLESFTVIDLSRALAGPYCTTMLADFGANVIKVESCTGGDPSRNWPPFDSDGRSLYYDSVNRNKRSMSIDFYSEEGREKLELLITHADVLVENFKFGTLEAMGFGPAKLSELNPGLLHVSINAYGQSGPLHNLPGLDQVIQAASGLTSVTGPSGGSGYRVGLPIVDIVSGMNAAYGVVTALLGKTRGVATEKVSTSLFESALALSVFQGQQAISLGEAPVAQGNSHPSIAPYGAFETETDSLVVAVSTDKHWLAFAEILPRVEWVQDERFATSAARTTNRDALDRAITEALSAKPAEKWIAAFRAAGIPSGPINDYKQAFESEQAQALGITQVARRSDGSSIPLVRNPLSMDGQPTMVRMAAPDLGEHTDEILHEMGIVRNMLVAAGRKETDKQR